MTTNETSGTFYLLAGQALGKYLLQLGTEQITLEFDYQPERHSNKYLGGNAETQAGSYELQAFGLMFGIAAHSRSRLRTARSERVRCDRLKVANLLKRLYPDQSAFRTVYRCLRTTANLALAEMPSENAIKQIVSMLGQRSTISESELKQIFILNGVVGPNTSKQI